MVALQAVGMLSHYGLAAESTLVSAILLGPMGWQKSMNVRLSSDEWFSFGQAAGTIRSTVPPRSRDKTASAELIGPDQGLL